MISFLSKTACAVHLRCWLRSVNPSGFWFGHMAQAVGLVRRVPGVLGWFNPFRGVGFVQHVPGVFFAEEDALIPEGSGERSRGWSGATAPERRICEESTPEGWQEEGDRVWALASGTPLGCMDVFRGIPEVCDLRIGVPRLLIDCGRSGSPCSSPAGC